MKKTAYCIIPLIVFLAGCLSGKTPVTEADGNPPGMDLDAAIREAAVQMEKNSSGRDKNRPCQRGFVFGPAF
jgi:hypothetical protein